MRPRPSVVPFAAGVVAWALLALACASNPKPTLAKFDAAALAAVNAIATVELNLSTLGKLTPQQSLDIRLKLRPVIDLGTQATQALLAWQPGNPTPESLLRLSTSIGDLLTTVIQLLPAGEAKAQVLGAIAVAQQAWATVIVIMTGGGA